MADILLELGIDLSGANADIKTAATRIKNEFEKVKPQLNIDGSVAQKSINSLGTSFHKLSKEAGLAQNQTKAAMAQLILQGQKGSAAYNQMERELKEATQQAKLLDAAMEQVNNEVTKTANTKMGNFKGEMKSSFNIGGMALGGGMAGAVMMGVDLLKKGVTEVIELGSQFETALADLSAITGVTGEDLKTFGASAQELAEKFGGSSIDQIETFKGVLSRLGPDIAKSPEALKLMADSINTMAKAAGIDATTSMESLTTAMLQFGVDLSDPVVAAEQMSLMMNTMAAGSKEGSAEIPQIASALEVAGSVAKSANVSFEETNAAIQVLATRGKQGAEAGTSLRNVLSQLNKGRFLPKVVLDELKAAGVNMESLSDKSLSLKDRLSALKPIMNDSALITKFFNSGNEVAAKALLEQSDSLEIFTKKLTGTKTATEQAAINMQTLAERAKRIKSVFQNMAIDIYQAIVPVILDIVDKVSPIFEGLWSGIQSGIKPLIDAVSGVYDAFVRLFDMFGDGESKTTQLKDAFAIYSKIITTVLTFALKTTINLLKNLIYTIGNVVLWFKELANSGTIAGNVIKFMWNAFKGLVGAITGAIKSVLEFLGLLSEDPPQAPLKKIQDEAKKTAKELKNTGAAADDFNGKFDETGTEGLTEQQKELRKLEWQYKNLGEQLGGLERGSDKYNNKLTEMIKIKNRIAIIKKAANGTGTGTKGLKQQQTELQKLEEQYKNLGDQLGALERGSDKFNNKLAEIIKVKSRIEEIKQAAKDLEVQINEGVSKLKFDNFIAKEGIGLSNIVKPANLAKDIKAGLRKELNAKLKNLNLDKQRLDIFGDSTVKVDSEIKGIQTKLNELEAPKIRLDGLDVVSIGMELNQRDVEKVTKDLKDIINTSSQAMTNIFAVAFESLFKSENSAVEEQTAKLNDQYSKQTDNLRAKLSAQEIAYDEYRNSQAEADAAYLKTLKESEKESKAIYEQIGAIAIQAATDTLTKMIPIWLVEIAGQEFATKGFAGIATAAILSGILLGLAGAAKSALGAEEGFNPFNNHGYGKKGVSDTIPIWVNPNEAILTARETQDNRAFIEHIKAGGNTESYLTKLQPLAIRDNSDTVAEIKALRNELKQTKLIETYHNNKIIIEDNRPVQIKTMNWGGR